MYTIRITGTGSEFQGVGRLEDGRVAFVRGAMPGELVAVDISRDRGKYVEAELIDILEKSDKRIDAVCPGYAYCGGCQALEMQYDYSLELKRKRVADALERLGNFSVSKENAKGLPKVFETISCEPDERLRNKVEFSIRGKKIGMCSRGTHVIESIDSCAAISNKLNSVLSWARDKLPEKSTFRYMVLRENYIGDAMVIFSGTGDDSRAAEKIASPMIRELDWVKSINYCALNRNYRHALDGKCRLLAGDSCLTEKLCGLEFSVSPQSFFQTNIHQAEKLYDAVMEAIGSGDELLDAYCGIGTMSLAALKRFNKVTGVEIVPSAIRDAKANALRNGLSDRAHFVIGDVASKIPDMKDHRFEAVIVDPPRAGLDKNVSKALCSLNIPRLVYVSCDPGTLARDMRLLTDGGYVPKWVKPLDMFPNTSHVEAIALFSGTRRS